MAKGNLFLGTARNKLGDVVLMRRDGEQVSRVRVRQIANPRTDAQTLSRLALNSATKTAQQLRGIIDHSFQGIKYGQTSVNHFTSKLTKEIRSFMEDALANPSAAPYGTAPVLPYAASGIGAGAKALISSGDLEGVDVFFYLGSECEMGLAKSVSEADPDEITAGAFLDYLGIAAGDQLTLVEGSPVALDYISETELFYGVRFDYLRINFAASLVAEDAMFTRDSDDNFKLSESCVDWTRTDPRVRNLYFSVDSGNLYTHTEIGDDAGNIFGTGLATDVCLMGAIVSRFENNAWRRSTCRLVQNPKTISGTAAAWESSYGYNGIQSCIELSVPSQKVTEDKYLNKEPNA